ncbi:MAG TPA: bifunctional methylenetetrahydrofolate dehydrogenase/methenyltetrahydrofolate cyclohydrolase FolD [Acidimicrobiia bacterium]|nr:bifunctional methylenetetrahydrofolate dehydrogenase/methenyltetrahydrofolate cyclohydrolase FolD [Acidimicrobiia bacterium]
MMGRILDGREVARAVKEEVAKGVAGLDYQPGLATVLVGDDPASHTYVRGKRRDAEEVGIVSFHHELPATVGQDELIELVESLNRQDEVDGILVQLPLPGDLDGEATVATIDPGKDVDGLHPFNLGKLMLGRPGLRPCTPSGVMRILDHYEIETSGARAVIVGRSFLVGRPLAMMLSERGADSTVSVAHSRTEDLAAITREADILVAAAGSPRLLGADHVKPGATVIDVGINRTDEGLVGDVDFDAVVDVAGAITPVPGGVGPMTRAMLLANTLSAAQSRRAAAATVL